MTSRSLLVGLPLLVAMLPAVACVATPVDSESVEQTAEPIKGGYSDTKDPAVVGIYWEAMGALCSGSLIAPNLVLTARHCVAPTSSNAVQCGVDTFGKTGAASGFYVTTRPTMDSMNPADYHTVQKVITPPQNGFCGNDQALLILSDTVSPDEAVPLVPRVDTQIAIGEGYSAIGFGGTVDDGSGAGTRRRLDNLKVQCVDDCPSYAVNKAKEWGGDHGICEGDSGGPAIDLQNRVIGVTSRGSAGCESPIYGYVFGWADLIKSTAIEAAQLGGYTPPGWATGFPTDPAYNSPLGGVCAAPTDCPSGACLNDGVATYCTRKCDPTAPCDQGYTCDANLGVCSQVHAAVKSAAAAPSTDSGCSLARPDSAADPTKPVPWFIGGALGALALLRRRRR